MPRENHKKNRAKKVVQVVDLFCGIGGMTNGFIKEDFTVVAGIDIDVECQYGYEKNNKAKFICKDIQKVSSLEIEKLYKKGAIRVLIGCAPCQPFSKLNLKEKGDNEFKPLRKFAELIENVKPDVVSMENVRGLVKYKVFAEFIERLKQTGYQVSYGIIDASHYGVPQRRFRLVLLASKLGPISLIKPTHLGKNKPTVRQQIGNLPPITDGEIHIGDVLHRSRKLDAINKTRIMSTPHDGGNMKSWNESLLLKCHKKSSGKSYKHSVYGRMRWDEPAPTITTQATGLGNGRFGHPEQDRAISLREAALLQTFPKSYRFYDPTKELIVKQVSKFIGNAVPVRLGQVIARSIKKHLKEVGKCV